MNVLLNLSAIIALAFIHLITSMSIPYAYGILSLYAITLKMPSKNSNLGNRFICKLSAHIRRHSVIGLIV